MIQGDLNAKTCTLEDTISPDKTDELFELNIDQPPQKRNSQYSAVNPRGNELLDMCKSLDLNIANGRKTGDPFGNYTCFKWNGSSVVDYLVSSSPIFKSIPLFKVGDFMPWLSDHCPNYFKFELHRALLDSQRKTPLEKKPPNNTYGLPKVDNNLWIRCKLMILKQYGNVTQELTIVTVILH